RLSKLMLFWDDNRITDDGSTALSISEDVPARFRAADWHVIEVDGHDIEAVSSAIAAAKQDPRPSMIGCRTIIGRGPARLRGPRGRRAGGAGGRATAEPSRGRPRRGGEAPGAGRPRRSRSPPTC